MSSLSQFALFENAGIDLSEFDHRCSWRRAAANEIVVDFQDPSNDVHLIFSGEVRVLIRTPLGKEVILADLRAGEIFGELAAIDDTPRSANVTAMSRSELCSVPAVAFRQILFSSSTVCDRVLRLLTARVRELDARLAEHSIFDLRHRLYAEIMRLSRPRAGHEGERIITPPPFHHVLASRIGCRREQITRELSTMEKQGLVDKQKGGLVIVKPATIEARLLDALSHED